MQKKVVVWASISIMLSLAAVLLLSTNLSPRIAQAEDNKVGVVSLHRDYFAPRLLRPTPNGQVTIPTALDELRVLVAKGALAANKAGWLCINSATEYDHDLNNNGTLPNGQAIPNLSISEDWLHLDDQLRVYESISIMRSADGQIVQVGVFSNGTVWNSATGESYSLSPWKLDVLDNGFSRNAARYAALMPLQKFETTWNGIPVVLYVMREQFNAPEQGVDFKQPANYTEQRAYFNPATGLLMAQETVVALEDGTERILARTEVEMQVGVVPPAEVLNYFAAKENSK